MRKVYLDYSATTPVKQEVLNEMIPYFTEKFGNPSSLYEIGAEAKEAITKAREQVAQLIGAKPQEVIFTSCGSESDNWALTSTAHWKKAKGNHIITTKIEHHAILHTCKALEKEGYQVTYLGVGPDGRIDLNELEQAITDQTILVSIMMVNNEAGSVMPVQQRAKLTHRLCPDAVFHTDAVQGFMKVPFQAKTLGADLISVSSHKVHSPKGCGALYIAPRLRSFPAFLIGGGQEQGLRSGTEGTPAIFSFAAACAAGQATFREDIAHEKALLNGVIEKLSALPEVVINGAHEAPHILSLSIPGVPTQNTINVLQDHGICVSAGSACAKGHRSHVLEAMKVAPEVIDGSFRVSLCKDNTEEELDLLMNVIRDEIIPRFCR